jgi:hypothetical protein
MDKRPTWLLKPKGSDETEVVPFDEDADTDTWTDGKVKWAIERIRVKARQRSRAEGTPPLEPVGAPLGRVPLRPKRR